MTPIEQHMSNATQRSLWEPRREPRPNKQARDFDRFNAIAANAILERPWAFGGESSFSVIWARCFHVRQANQARLKRPRAESA